MKQKDTPPEDALVNPPRQARSEATLQAIVGAARTLLREREFASLSIDEIVRAAGSSKGSFYQRFPDKQSLLVYVLREEHNAALADWSQFLDTDRLRSLSLAGVMDAFIDRLMDIYRQRPSLMRAYAQEVEGGDGETRRLAAALNQHVQDLLLAIVIERRDELSHRDPETAVAFLFSALISMLPGLFLHAPEAAETRLSHDVLEAELRAMVAAYLGLT